MIILFFSAILSFAQTPTTIEKSINDCPPHSKKVVAKDKSFVCKIKKKGKLIPMTQAELDEAWSAILPGAMPPAFSKLFSPKTDKIKELEIDSFNHCYLTQTGKMKCWGENLSGSIGNNTTVKSFTPIEINLQEIKQVRRRGDTTCALVNPGNLKCWGGYFDDTIKDGEISRTLEHEKMIAPIELKTPGIVQDFSLGGDFKCIVSDGKAYCSGRNAQGELGNGELSAEYTDWLEVKGLSKGVNKVVSALHHSCALMDSGKVKCWGSNVDGALGSIDKSVLGPIEITGLENVKTIGLGNKFSCVLLKAGNVKCWGSPEFLGIGSEEKKNIVTPTLVSGLDTGVLQLSVRDDSSCALLVSGEVRCWGQNNLAQLGDGTREKRAIPVVVKNLESADLIAVGKEKSCAVQKDNKMKCWGVSPTSESSKVVVNETAQEVFGQ
ncbi:MAG: RCC1 domain-containing protein [Bacteriovoracaceae bacterium]